MSKQSEAKAAQGYVEKAEPRVCGVCQHFLFELIPYRGAFGGTYHDEKNKRCGIGGFAVKKMGVCDRFQRKA